ASGTIKVNVTGSASSLRWDNSVGGGNGQTWDIATVATSKNWVDTNTNLGEFFFQNDNVLFNDTNSGKYAVTLSGVLTPGSMTVNNSAGNYTFGGSGSIGGLG